MQLIRPDFTNFCDNDTTFVILLLTTICETTHKQCRRTAFARLVHPHGLWKLKPRNSPKRDVEGAVPYNSKHNATQIHTKTKADGFPEQAVPTAAKKSSALLFLLKFQTAIQYNRMQALLHACPHRLPPLIFQRYS